MADKYEKLVAELLLNDPETDIRLDVASPIQPNPDGSYSFEVQNPETQVKYRHTIKTEEV